MKSDALSESGAEDGEDEEDGEDGEDGEEVVVVDGARSPDISTQVEIFQSKAKSKDFKYLYNLKTRTIGAHTIYKTYHH